MSRAYRDIQFTALLAEQVEEGLPDDAVALARGGVDTLGVEHLLDDEIHSHRLFEFGGAGVVRPASPGERPVELLQQLALLGTEPDPRRRRPVVRHTDACKADGISVCQTSAPTRGRGRPRAGTAVGGFA